MMNRTKELTKNTFIIAIGKISTQFVTFLLLPLYTAFLSTEQYGTVDIIITIVHLLIPITSLMIDQGVFRFLLNCNTEDNKKRTVSSAIFVLTGINLIITVLYFGISVFLKNYFKFWVLLILIVTSYSNFFLQIARGLKHTNDYTLGSFVCSTSTIVLNVFCIAFLKIGAIGMLISTFLGNLTCSIFLFFRLNIWKYISLESFKKKTMQEELKYSLPLVPNQLSLWVMNSFDRLIVAYFMGASANGILAVSHKFPAIFMTFFNIFQLAWHETGTVHYFDTDRDEFFSDMIRKILFIFSTLCMCVLVILPLVFKWLVNDSYFEAYYNIPIYLVASLFNIIIGLLGVVYVAIKKTTEIAKTTFIAAIVNIIISIVLIPYIGLYAASISTLISYAVTMIYRIVDTRRYLKIKYDFKQFIFIGLSLIICCIIYYINNIVLSMLFLPIFFCGAYFLNRVMIKSLIYTLRIKKRGKICDK